MSPVHDAFETASPQGQHQTHHTRLARRPSWIHPLTNHLGRWRLRRDVDGKVEHLVAQIVFGVLRSKPHVGLRHAMLAVRGMSFTSSMHTAASGPSTDRSHRSNGSSMICDLTSTCQPPNPTARSIEIRSKCFNIEYAACPTDPQPFDRRLQVPSFSTRRFQLKTKVS